MQLSEINQLFIPSNSNILDEEEVSATVTQGFPFSTNGLDGILITGEPLEKFSSWHISSGEDLKFDLQLSNEYEGIYLYREVETAQEESSESVSEEVPYPAVVNSATLLEYFIKNPGSTGMEGGLEDIGAHRIEASTDDFDGDHDFSNIWFNIVVGTLLDTKFLGNNTVNKKIIFHNPNSYFNNNLYNENMSANTIIFASAAIPHISGSGDGTHAIFHTEDGDEFLHGSFNHVFGIPVDDRTYLMRGISDFSNFFIWSAKDKNASELIKVTTRDEVDEELRKNYILIAGFNEKLIHYNFDLQRLEPGYDHNHPSNKIVRITAEIIKEVIDSQWWEDEIAKADSRSLDRIGELVSKWYDHQHHKLRITIDDDQRQAQYLQKELIALSRKISRNQQLLIVYEQNTGSHEADKFIASLDKLKNMDKVKRAYADTRVNIETEMLYCEDPRTGILHEIGEFVISISPMGDSDNIVKWTNLTHSISAYESGMQAPHVFARGNACFGNIGENLINLVAELELEFAFQIAIQFIESVNTDDSAGRHIDKWPVAPVPMQKPDVKYKAMKIRDEEISIKHQQRVKLRKRQHEILARAGTDRINWARRVEINRVRRMLIESGRIEEPEKPESADPYVWTLTGGIEISKSHWDKYYQYFATSTSSW